MDALQIGPYAKTIKTPTVRDRHMSVSRWHSSFWTERADDGHVVTAVGQLQEQRVESGKMTVYRQWKERQNVRTDGRLRAAADRQDRVQNLR